MMLARLGRLVLAAALALAGFNPWSATAQVRVPGPGGSTGVAVFASKLESKAASFTSTNTANLTFVTSLVANDAVVCGWEGNGAITVPVVTDGGTPNTYLEAVSGAPNAQVRAFYAVVTVNTGALTVTANWTTNRTGRFSCDAFRGGAQTTTATLLDTTGSAATGTAQTTANAPITVGSTGYLVWAHCRFSATSGTETANNSYLFGTQSTSAPTFYKLSATSTSETPSISWVNSIDYICLPLSLKP